MISEREKGIYQIFNWMVALGMFAYCAACFGLMYLIRDDLDTAPWSYARFALIGLVSLLAEGGTRPEEWRATPGRCVGRFRRYVTQRQWLWLCASAGLSLFVFRDMQISRAFVLYYTLTTLPLLYASNRWGYSLLTRCLSEKSARWRLRTALIGPDEWLPTVTDHVNGIGHILELSGEYRITRETDFVDLTTWIEQRGMDLLVFPAELLPEEWVARLISLGERRGFRCWLPLELTRRFGWRFNLQSVGGLDVLTPPSHPLGNTFNRMLKRGFDVAFSLMVVSTVLLPLMAMVALLHRRYSPGPLFFRQNRFGENGSVFEVIKFRTMHLNNDNEGRQASKSDPRIFKGGDLLRKLSIDEFPQFLNVLNGEMSVVGPRPHLEVHEREFEKHYERYGMRRFVKPGVTGLAQIRGYRGEIRKPSDIRGRGRFDLIYVRNWCVLLDFRIIFQTALQVVRPHRNAY
jgi:lipopolysaccharide/colanic/teichoic acid biosynthesis glycosyltransferase